MRRLILTVVVVLVLGGAVIVAVGALHLESTEFYGNVQTYTDQLRALEKFVGENRSAPEGRFLVGFHYLMDGHPETARKEFLQALKLTPQDRLAAQLLTQAGGTVPADIGKQLPQLPAAQQHLPAQGSAQGNGNVPGASASPSSSKAGAMPPRIPPPPPSP